MATEWQPVVNTGECSRCHRRRIRVFESLNRQKLCVPCIVKASMSRKKVKAIVAKAMKRRPKK